MKSFFGRFGRRTWIIVGVAAVVVVIVVSVLNARARARGTSQYETQPAQRGELVAMVGATGSVRAVQSALLNWQTTGTVNGVNVKAGDVVKNGDVLATLSNTSLPGTVIRAEADLIAAQKALDDLLHSDTNRANAWISLRDTQDAYDKANDYRNSLNGVIWLTRVTTNYFRGRAFPVVHSYRGYADPDTIAKADADLALKKRHRRAEDGGAAPPRGVPLREAVPSRPPRTGRRRRHDRPPRLTPEPVPLTRGTFSTPRGRGTGRRRGRIP